MAIIFLTMVNLKSRNRALFIIYAFLLSGFSLSFYDSSLFYSLAVICGIENKLQAMEKLKYVKTN